MLENNMVHFMEHILNDKHQLAVIRNLKIHLNEAELVIHVDFSENYDSKYVSETQYVHIQVLYTVQVTSRKHFVLHPLTYLKQFPTVSSIHFMSDSQAHHRHKTMYALMRYYILKKFPQIRSITWNHSEAGHGKGAPDAVGAVLKRTADCIVTEGNYISDFDTLVARIEYFWSTHSEFFPGSMRVHQVKWRRNIPDIHFWRLGCFVYHTGLCSHYHIGCLTTNIVTKGSTNGLIRRTSTHEWSDIVKKIYSPTPSD
ncbi:hypothetical protein PR048_001557 [Dryococelus australis]|uniref:Uncharacterized protein n=1 Tax=Dryococelus australis TaxID=614101 RepID=A0ABQ9IJ35_9NEOP|nr:hypothetical protein PR048_001557 [Dryococelus australis]